MVNNLIRSGSVVFGLLFFALFATPPAQATQTANIACNASIQTAINANPAGTTFYLAGTPTSPCTYSGQLLNLSGKDGDIFNGGGMTVTILDGAGALGPMLNAGWSAYGGTQTTNITMQHLTIENYAQSTSTGGAGVAYTCGGYGSAELYAWSGWVLNDVKIANSQCVGVDMGYNATLKNSLITNNGMVGINANDDASLSGTVTISGNEISNNDTRQIGLYWDASGIKVAGGNGVRNVSFLNNYVHDNYGEGFWCDINCAKTLTVQGNTFINNWDNGVMVEILSTGAATVSNNVIKNSSTSVNTSAGVYVSSSSGVNVNTNNILVAPGLAGISVQTDSRVTQISNDTVSGNTVTFASTTGREGFANYQSVPATNVTSNRNAFYVIGTGDAHWYWSPSGGVTNWPLIWSSYKSSTGQDTNSSLSMGNASVAGCTQIGCTGSGWPKK